MAHCVEHLGTRRMVRLPGALFWYLCCAKGVALVYENEVFIKLIISIMGKIAYVLKKRTARLGKHKGKEVYQARTRSTNVLSEEALAREVATSVSLNPYIIEAVWKSTRDNILMFVKNGYAVNVPGIGVFRPVIKSVEVPVESSSFHPNSHIKEVSVGFTMDDSMSLKREDVSFVQVDSGPQFTSRGKRKKDKK